MGMWLALHKTLCMHVHIFVNVFTNISFNPIALRKTKIAYNFGLSECNNVKI